MDRDDAFVTWGAWTGWILLVVMVSVFFLLSEPEPECCKNAECECYEVEP